MIHDLFQMLNWYAAGAIIGGAWMVRYQRPAAVALVKHPLWEKLESLAAQQARTARLIGPSHYEDPIIIENSGTVETSYGHMTVVIQRSTGKVES